MNKTIVFIVIVILLALAGILYFAKQNFSFGPADRSIRNQSNTSQTNNNQSTPSPSEQDLRDEIEKELNDIEKSLNEESLGDSDLNF